MSFRARAKRNLLFFFELLKESTESFIENGVMKYSASLSYYTIFSIAPMLIMAIAVGSFLFGKDAIEGNLFRQINSIVGNDAARQIQDMLRHTTLHKNSFFATTIAIIVFIVGATGVFGEIQSTINKIWGLKAKPKKGLIKYFMNRILSFAMVVSIGFLMIVSLLASAMIGILNDKLNNFLPNTTLIINIVNNIVALLIISLFFTIIFKYLPDSIVKWKDAFVGSVFTSILFLLGKYVIGLYLNTSTTASAYGAAGSLIIILLWIYYSSILLYFGAEFTKIYALKHGHGIRPNKFSVRVEYYEKEISYLTK